MDDARQRELAAIRLIQQDLRRKLEAVDERLSQLERSTETAREAETLPGPAQRNASDVPVMVVAESKTAELTNPPELPELSRPDWLGAKAPVRPEKPGPSGAETGGPPVTPAATPKERESFEVQFGRVWLVRAGILMLLTGLVFLGNLAWHEVISKVGAGGKLVLIFLAGGGLCGFGWWVGRRQESLAGYGRVVLGGGLATLYYACYAAHFVEPLRVIASPLLGGVLLLAFSGGLLWLADRLKSQTVASATILLGFYTASINPLTGFSLLGNLVLTVVAVVLFLRRRWVSISFLTLVGCYVSFAFWRFHATGSLGWIRVEPGGAFWNAFLFPTAYWLIFSVATFVARPPDFSRAGRAVFLTLNNGAFFGLAAPLVAGTYPGNLWAFSLVFGAVLIGLSLLASRLEPDDRGFDGAYLTQGLGLLMLAGVFRLSGYQLALMLALQSAACMGLSRLRHPWVFQFFAGLAATLAAGWSLAGLAGDVRQAAFTAGAVSVVLVGVAWTFKKQRGGLDAPALSWRASGFVGLAAILGLCLVAERLEGGAAIAMLAGLGMAAAFSPLVLRLPELALAGQFFGLSAAAGWFLQSSTDRSELLPVLAVMIGVLALLHWWQCDRFRILNRPVSLTLQALNGCVAVVVTLVWALGRFSDGWEGVVVAGAALGFLVYGLLTRAMPLAFFSQVASMVLLLLLTAGFLRRDPWGLTVGAAALFALQAPALDWLRNRLPESFGIAATAYQVFLRGVGVLFGLLAAHAYVAPDWRFTILVVGAAAVVLRAAFSAQAREFLIYAAVWTGVGLFEFLVRQSDGPGPLAANALGLFLMLAAAEAARRSTGRLAAFSAPWRCIVNVLAIGGIWLLVGRFVAAADGGILLTISWSVLAFAVLGAGFVLHERTYRLSGLVILAAAVSRVFLVDVWQLETLPRILSFLVLGAVLLALGFLYNRFAEAIRRWL